MCRCCKTRHLHGLRSGRGFLRQERPFLAVCNSPGSHEKLLPKWLRTALISTAVTGKIDIRGFIRKEDSLLSRPTGHYVC